MFRLMIFWYGQEEVVFATCVRDNTVMNSKARMEGIKHGVQRDTSFMATLSALQHSELIRSRFMYIYILALK